MKHEQGWSGVALVASILLGALGQLFMRAGMNTLHDAIETQPLSALIQTLSPTLLPVIMWTLGGLTAYATSLLCWMITLKRFDLSFAYPMLSLSYLLVYLGAVFWPALHESVSLGKTIGILTIIVGVIFITHSHRRSIKQNPSK